jgi:hypothetical protein
VEGDRAVEAGAIAEAGLLLLPEARPSRRLGASRLVASPRPFLPFGRRTLPGSSTGCVFTTSTSVSRPTTALPPAIGETSFPGASQRRSSRPTGPHHGPAFTQAFSGGHRRRLFSFSAFFNQRPKRSSLGWCCWAAYFLLGRPDFSPLFRRLEFQLAFSAGCSPVSHYWCRFFAALRTISGSGR